MFTGKMTLTIPQRDKLLRKVERLHALSDAEQASRPIDCHRYYDPDGVFERSKARECRYRRVARRLTLFISGAVTSQQWLLIGAAINNRHINCETEYDEWLEELRWLGLKCTPGTTQLSPESQAERDANLRKKFAVNYQHPTPQVIN